MSAQQPPTSTAGQWRSYFDALIDGCYYYTGLPLSHNPSHQARKRIADERRERLHGASIAAPGTSQPQTPSQSPSTSTPDALKQTQSPVRQWTTEADFARRLHESGKPAIVVLSVNGDAFSEQFKPHFYRTAAEFHEAVDFVWVKCVNAQAFCRSRQVITFPHVELYESRPEGEHVPGQPRRYRVSITPFPLHMSYYGLREMLRQKDMLGSFGYRSNGAADDS
ncbi:hypothetical protein CAOG_02471 [Capsaspora owczarzaki ATCC 30864]|uniref:Thioredoxin-like fold domain-containing protein n=1 Tax=Capsaspora owczarzaki (strain ATCC 30864) TaxID=595528 RepID=A0A0D2WME6_CAPO3|nr:hypothetical protein CAOG_02471 [Capsaspora owczarzaki ATCC 30864]KJE91318.1 hypothetical protein CAOG_002471 [Capsaspora owczarzaki ATCC 30864]|eukprot:XP_004349221.1 hypothetical protein CAOG_02471 [Capsaspora owczarzaki ATCC 30864]